MDPRYASGPRPKKTGVPPTPPPGPPTPPTRRIPRFDPDRAAAERQLEQEMASLLTTDPRSADVDKALAEIDLASTPEFPYEAEGIPAGVTSQEYREAKIIGVPYTLQHVRVDRLRFDPRYQPKVPRSQRWADQIAREFDPDKLRPLDVSLRDDGEMYVMDGGHRWTAMNLRGMATWEAPCHVFVGLTLAQEAKIFNTQDSTRRLTAQQRFRSRLLEGDQLAHEIRRDVEAAGYLLNLDDSRGGHSRIVSIAAIEQARNLAGRRRFQTFLRICRTAWRDDTVGFANAVISGLSSLIIRYDGMLDERRLVEKLGDTTPAMLERDAKEMRKIVGLGTYAKDAVGFIIVDRYNQRLSTNKLPPWSEMDARLQRSRRASAEETAGATERRHRTDEVLRRGHPTGPETPS